MSIPDWISATSDVVMAGSAIIGVLYAKKWFNQVINEEGTKLSLKLLEQTFPDLIESLNKRPGQHQYLSFIADECIKGNYINNKETLDWFIDEFISNAKEFKRHRVDLLICMGALERRGFNLLAKKKSLVIHILAACASLEILLDEAYDLISLIRIKSSASSTMFDVMRHNRYGSNDYDSDTLLQMLKGKCVEMDNLQSECYRDYTEFVSGDPHISSFFLKVK
ncbi:hypothetical protein [Scandinavium manionii]|uniref:hypothetical protein n=1 Tax=Scandinavium manionii TaxID=2926520 RepID=UPI00216514BA|nr:hypothetical protein [Scandinavium manionii]MCS2164577.1 hypothetical protein [Scandinavium manionii]